MSIIKQWFPIPLILFGGIMADLSRHGLGEDIMTVQIVSWTSVAVGVVVLARIAWLRVKK